MQETKSFVVPLSTSKVVNIETNSQTAEVFNHGSWVTLKWDTDRDIDVHITASNPSLNTNTYGSHGCMQASVTRSASSFTASPAKPVTQAACGGTSPIARRPGKENVGIAKLPARHQGKRQVSRVQKASISRSQSTPGVTRQLNFTAIKVDHSAPYLGGCHHLIQEEIPSRGHS